MPGIFITTPATLEEEKHGFESQGILEWGKLPITGAWNPATWQQLRLGRRGLLRDSLWGVTADGWIQKEWCLVFHLEPSLPPFSKITISYQIFIKSLLYIKFSH